MSLTEKETKDLLDYLRRNNNDAEEDDCTEQQWEDQNFGEYLYNKIDKELNENKQKKKYLCLKCNKMTADYENDVCKKCVKTMTIGELHDWVGTDSI